MANIRSFAGCLAMAVVALASTAQAVTFNWADIQQASGSNAPYLSNPGFPGGIGSVSYSYQMSKTETTRGQYAEFLNKVATNTSAPSYVTALWSGSTNLGISRTVSGSAYTYAVVGDPQLPVSNVTWTSAARFVNWLNAGQPTVTSNTSTWNSVLNTGAYALSTSSTGSTVVARSASMTTTGTNFFLPSANEWVKAAFYNPNTTTWNTWQNGSSTQPTATSVASGSNNVAVYATGTFVPDYAALPVGSLPNSQSPYGLYDMLGNVTEMTDTANGANNWFGVSGNYSIAAANIGSWNINNNRYLSAVSSANGFRVAGFNQPIAPVPEPETITLAAFGIVGLCGANWLKRRRKAGAQPMAEALAA